MREYFREHIKSEHRVKGAIKRNKNSLDNNQLCLGHLVSPGDRRGEDRFVTRLFKGTE